MLKTISSTMLASSVTEVLDDLERRRTPYIVEDSGRPAAALVSLEDFSLLQRLKEKVLLVHRRSAEAAGKADEGSPEEEAGTAQRGPALGIV
jgi:PHD/YefM family antitoxin component YafN of YafNO toxin-antitoxin module